MLGYLQSAVGLKHVPPIVPVGHNTSLDPLEFRGVGKYSVLFLLVLSPMTYNSMSTLIFSLFHSAKLLKCATATHSIHHRLKTVSCITKQMVTIRNSTTWVALAPSLTTCRGTRVRFTRKQNSYLIIFGGAFPIIIINIFEYIVYEHVED